MSGSLVGGWRRWGIYAVAWLCYLTIYLAAFIVNGVPPGFALRNALATVLPDALLGLAILRLPGRLHWPEERRALAGVSYAWLNAAARREQTARAARAEALRARAELEAMRSQLNPHFILNTFHALVGLVRRQPAVAEEALERLGDLLRYSLRTQRGRRFRIAPAPVVRPNARRHRADTRSDHTPHPSRR